MFSPKMESVNLKGQFQKGPNVFRHLLWKLIDHFYLATPSMLSKTKTLEKKKAIFPVNKRFWPIFSRNIECDKCQGTMCKGPKRYSDNYCGSNRIISVSRKRLVKTQISVKKSNHSSEKKLLTIFLVLSSTANLRQQIITVHKVF